MKRYAMSVGLAILLAGCATTAPQEVGIEQRTRVYRASKPQVVQAIVSYCNIRTFTIQTINENMGIVNTDWKVVEPDMVTQALMGNVRFKLNFSAQATTDTTTKVVLLITTERQQGAGWTTAKDTKATVVGFYGSVFDQVQNLVDDPNWLPPPKE